MWKMFHQSNAIEAAALTVRFAEPLSAMVTKKMTKKLEEIASDNMFTERQPLQQVQLQINSQNADFMQTNLTGMVFQHTSVVRDRNGNVGPQIARQMFAQPDQLVMKVHHYRGWEKEWAATQKMFGPALEVAASTVPVGAFRLEYLNRFLYEGPSEGNHVRELLKESGLLSGHVFDAPDLWHSHTGRFDDVSDVGRRLIQVNADSQIISEPFPTAGLQTLALMLGVERQFLLPGLELEPSSAAKKLDEFFSCLHEDIHGLFKQVVDSNFASENNLPL